MNDTVKAYLVWALQCSALAAQAYLAWLAQTNPKFVWLSPVISIAQATMPNPFAKK